MSWSADEGHDMSSFGFCVSRVRAQELCESRGGRPGLPSLINLQNQNLEDRTWKTEPVDVKQHFNNNYISGCLESSRDFQTVGLASQELWSANVEGQIVRSL